MVYLSRIYTKTGDHGETSLGNGVRVAKDHIRVAAYGTVDELNSVLGVLLTQPDVPAEIADVLGGVQNDLFDVGADLCLPLPEGDEPDKALRIDARQAHRLEETIDRFNAGLEPLRSFVLPGGSAAAAWCHLARTVCRRAERDLVTLTRTETINPHVIVYLNRLSDLLFVLARVANDQGKNDVLWEPGKSQVPRA